MDLTIIKFYRNQYSVNNRDVYLFEEILKRTDNQLEIEHDFIQWLFPDETGGVNSNAPHMTPELYEIFKTDKKIRYNVIRATIRMMNFYGYSFNFRNQTIHQIKELYRKENDHIVGLYSSHNYKRLTRMMRFLVLVDLPILSAMVFLCLCDAMKQDEKLLKQINNSGALNYWINTQTYLSEYTKKDILESLIGNLRNPDEVCFQGLEYVNNSCYQDVILLALFAKENPIIDNAIIYTDINALVKNKKNYANCGDDEKEDLENRTVIQEELKNIALYMRKKTEKKVYKCSKLRKLFKYCESGEKFRSFDQQDAGEYLMFLFDIFNVNLCMRNEKTFFCESLEMDPKSLIKTRDYDSNSSPIINISSHSLLDAEDDEVNLKDYLYTAESSVLENPYKVPGTTIFYPIKITVTTIKNADFLVLYLNRVHGDVDSPIKITKKVIIPETLNIERKKLRLYCITVHKSSHYTAFIKCGGNWFYYDDLKGGLSHHMILIGSFEDVLEHSINPSKNGTLFFYT